MKMYKVLITTNSSYIRFEKSLNQYAKEGYILKFFTQSESSEDLHHTAILEKEVSDALS